MITEIDTLVTQSLLGFVNDPADSDYQRGFLAAMIQCAETLMIDDQAPLIEELKKQLRTLKRNDVADLFSRAAAFCEDIDSLDHEDRMDLVEDLLEAEKELRP